MASPAEATCSGGCYSYSLDGVSYSSPQYSGSLMWMYNNQLTFTSSD